MKVFFTILCAGVLALSSCQKEKNFLDGESVFPKAEACQAQTANPDGQSYSGRSFISFTYDKKNCGLIPLSTKNYWVYQDSVYMNGSFARIQYDTLRFTNTYKTIPDELIWWESNLSIGIPEILYANDSALFSLEDRMFSSLGIKDVSKDLSLFKGDTLLYLANFEDMAAMGKSIKMHSALKTPAGTFYDCVFFEKDARSYRKDQVILKPGVGVIKYIHQEAPMGGMDLKIQKIMTLVSMHLE